MPLVRISVYNSMTAATKRFSKPKDEVALRECPECLSDIPAAARRCKFCTAAVASCADSSASLGRTPP